MSLKLGDCVETSYGGDSGPMSAVNGRYHRFQRELGRGAYKHVYHAYDTVECVDVAWNVIEIDSLPSDAERAKIMREVNMLSGLRHPHILRIRDHWLNPEHNQLCFITDIIQSGSLRRFNHERAVNLGSVKKWCRQILQALGYLHGREPPVIHRDIKCDNIFIDGPTGNVTIGDLGLSTHIASADLKKGLSLVGTPEFMAPELYTEKYDVKVDIYAFGMCVLEMITKKYPYDECDNAVQLWKTVSSKTPPKALATINKPSVRAFVEFCIEFEPLKRPTALECLEHPFLQYDTALDRMPCSQVVGVQKPTPTLPIIKESRVHMTAMTGLKELSATTLKGVGKKRRSQSRKLPYVYDCRARYTGTKEDMQIDLKLNLSNERPHRVTFKYKPKTERIHTVVSEMVQQLNLDPLKESEMVSQIARKVKHTMQRELRDAESAQFAAAESSSTQFNDVPLSGDKTLAISDSNAAKTKKMKDATMAASTIHVALAGTQPVAVTSDVGTIVEDTDRANTSQIQLTTSTALKPRVALGSFGGEKSATSTPESTAEASSSQQSSTAFPIPMHAAMPVMVPPTVAGLTTSSPQHISVSKHQNEVQCMAQPLAGTIMTADAQLRATSPRAMPPQMAMFPTTATHPFATGAPQIAMHPSGYYPMNAMNPMSYGFGGATMVRMAPMIGPYSEPPSSHGQMATVPSITMRPPQTGIAVTAQSQQQSASTQSTSTVPTVVEAIDDSLLIRGMTENRSGIVAPPPTEREVQRKLSTEVMELPPEVVKHSSADWRRKASSPVSRGQSPTARRAQSAGLRGQSPASRSQTPRPRLLESASTTASTTVSSTVEMTTESVVSTEKVVVFVEEETTTITAPQKTEMEMKQQKLEELYTEKSSVTHLVLETEKALLDETSTKKELSATQGCLRVKLRAVEKEITGLKKQGVKRNKSVRMPSTSISSALEAAKISGAQTQKQTAEKQTVDAKRSVATSITTTTTVPPSLPTRSSDTSIDSSKQSSGESSAVQREAAEMEAAESTTLELVVPRSSAIPITHKTRTETGSFSFPSLSPKAPNFRDLRAFTPPSECVTFRMEEVTPFLPPEVNQTVMQFEHALALEIPEFLRRNDGSPFRERLFRTDSRLQALSRRLEFEFDMFKSDKTQLLTMCFVHSPKDYEALGSSCVNKVSERKRCLQETFADAIEDQRSLLELTTQLYSLVTAPPMMFSTAAPSRVPPVAVGTSPANLAPKSAASTPRAAVQRRAHSHSQLPGVMQSAPPGTAAMVPAIYPHGFAPHYAYAPQQVVYYQPQFPSAAAMQRPATADSSSAATTVVSGAPPKSRPGTGAQTALFGTHLPMAAGMATAPPPTYSVIHPSLMAQPMAPPMSVPQIAMPMPPLIPSRKGSHSSLPMSSPPASSSNEAVFFVESFPKTEG